MAAPQQIPLTIAISPFPEGFQGDMDETFQQAVALMEAFVEGNFLTGLTLPPGSTLPTSDQGPIAMGGVWYFWDPTTGQYLPQTVSSKIAKNFVKNCVYQVQQTGSVFTVGAGATNTYDMALTRSTLGSVLAIAADIGPAAGVDNDYCPVAIKYTVSPTPVPTPGTTDLYAHEHLLEGADIAMIRGEVLSLSFSVWVNQPGVYSVYLTSSGRDASYVANFTITIANTWTRIKILGIPALPTTTGTWSFAEGATGLYIGIAMLVGTQWQQAPANLNGWHAGFWAGSASNINMCAVVNNQLKISGIKLEASPQVSYLSVPSFDADLWEATRYYFTNFNYQSQTAGLYVRGMVPLAGQYLFNELFPRRMAKVPTVVPYSCTTPTAGSITDVTAGYNVALANLGAVQKGLNVWGGVPIVTTGTTNSTINITAIPSTIGMVVGMAISGSGIPAGATIASIVSGTAITISAAATSGASGVALTITTALTIVTTGTTVSLTVNITAIPSTTGMTVGMAISGSGIPAGATIASIVSGTAITISAAATSGASGVALTITTALTIVTTGTTVSLTVNITAIPSTTGMTVGMAISGSGIPAGATIASIVSGTAITISAAATSGASGVALTITQVAKGDALLCYYIADARLT